MPEATAIINVRVLAHWMIQRFAGRAVLAGTNPRFVVCVLVLGSEEQWQIPGTDVSLGTQRVVFFAVDSLTRVFADSEVIGKDFRMRLDRLLIDGRARYTLGIAE